MFGLWVLAKKNGLKARQAIAHIGFHTLAIGGAALLTMRLTGVALPIGIGKLDVAQIAFPFAWTYTLTVFWHVPQAIGLAVAAAVCVALKALT